MNGESESVIEANAIRTHGNRIRKIYQFGAVLIAVALISSGLTLVAIGDGPSGFPTAIMPGSMVEDASYIIFFDEGEGKYFAKNGTTGEMASSSTNASATINYALTHLTADRTWKERVILKGEFTIDYPITMQSYSILEATGRVTLEAASNCNMIRSSGGASDFELIGGIYDGNEDEQTPAEGNIAHLVELTDAHNVTITSITTLDSCYDHIILTGDSSDIVIDKWIGSGGRDDGFNPLAASNVVVTDSIATDMSNDGFHISVGSDHISLTNCIAYDNGDNGFKHFEGGSNLTLMGCTAYNNVYCGFLLQGIDAMVQSCHSYENGNTGYWTTAGGEGTSGRNVTIANSFSMNNVANEIRAKGPGIIIAGNNLQTNGEWGIYAEAALGIQIINNRIYGPGTYDGIALQSGCSGALISGNRIEDSQRRDLTIYATNTDVRVIANYFGQSTVVDGGTETIFRDNIGYLTVNSGASTVTGSVSYKSVYHELSVTPISVIVTTNNTGCGDYAVTEINPSYFVITFTTQPGASTWTFYWYAQSW